MPSYHPAAEREFDHLLSVGSRDIKIALGLVVQRHHRINNGSEPLSAAERLPASGPSLQPMHQVTHNAGLAEVTAVYQTTVAGVQVLAFDAWDRFVRVGAPASAGDARSRAWARAS